MMLDMRKTKRASLTLVVLGREEWLQGIYASFCPSSSMLTGRVKVRPTQAGQVEVEGELSYEPRVNCSRCWDKVACPLQVKFKVCYRRQRQKTWPKTLTLGKDDLDAYYYDGHRIDLAELINEQVQLAMPDSTVPAIDNGSICGHCQIDLRDPLVYGTQQ